MNSSLIVGRRHLVFLEAFLSTIYLGAGVTSVYIALGPGSCDLSNFKSRSLATNQLSQDDLGIVIFEDSQ